MQNIAKKIIPYLFILITIIGIGLFGWAGEADAMGDDPGTCTAVDKANPQKPETIITKNVKEEKCYKELKPSAPGSTVSWLKDGASPPTSPTTPTTYLECTNSGKSPKECKDLPGSPTQPETYSNEEKTPFETKLNLTCKDPIDNFSGCFLQVMYWLFHDIPALLLLISGYFFNILVAISLDGELLRSAFVGEAWGIVRDLSNIFFILILLYIAVKIILDLGGHEVKKTIANVVIMALLINFSMFFTQVIIDTSNVLALVFYNKMKVTTVNPDGFERQYSSIKNEKDISGGLVASFDPTTKILSSGFFDQIEKKYDGNGKILDKETNPIGFGTKLAIIILSGAIMIVATYVFFVSGFFFLGRLIELWVLIIFSPFAFMSYSIPELAGIQELGWQSWLKRLVSSSFMAPIFMFFMYFIFMLIASPLFKNLMPTSTQTDGVTGWIKIILNVLLPFILICVLLLKAKDYAKKGSGQFGEAVMSVAKVAGGVALGAATGGASMVGTATLGRAGAAVANSGWAKKLESKGVVGAGLLRSGAKSLGSGSFDLRGIKIAGKTLGSATGMSVGEARKGGFTERRAEQVTKRQKRAKELEVGEDEKLKQDLNAVEEDLQELLKTNSHELEELDKKIKGAREKASDAERASKADPTNQNKQAVATAAADEVMRLRQEKSDRKSATGAYANNRINGRSINDLEDHAIPDAHHELERENRRRRWIHADSTEGALGQAREFVFSGGQHSFRGAREAAHRIRMDARIENRGDGHAPAAAHPAPAHGPAPAAAPAHGPAPAAGGGHGGGGGGHGGHP